jgi:hypothetical protein
MLVHLTRQVIDTQRRLLTAPDTTAANGAHELVIALRDAQGAQLGSYADGWADPGSFWDEDIPTCAEAEPIIRLDVDEWPTDDDQAEQLLIRASSRISDTFNDEHRRFLVRSGPHAGTLRPEYA